MAPEVPHPSPEPHHGPAGPARARLLAWLALLANGSLLLLLAPWWLVDPHLRTANLVVGLAAVLPVAATGIVGSLAELGRRGWGRIVSLVALSLALLLELSYGITRLVLVADGRLWLAIACALSWLITLGLLLERSLRPSPADRAASNPASAAATSRPQRI